VKTALLVIATGDKYREYVQPLLASARTYFVPHTAVVFSDFSDIGHGERPFTVIEHENWPGPTLHRYHNFIKVENFLRCFDHLFYVDVDMLFVNAVKEEDVFSNGITAVLHPGYVNRVGTPERRSESEAYLPNSVVNKYFCGGFIGGQSEHFLKMAKTIASSIDIDSSRGITAIWHDESHQNKYLYHNPPSKILTPSFCYPEDYSGQWGWKPEDYKPVLVALNKKKRNNHWSQK